MSAARYLVLFVLLAGAGCRSTAVPPTVAPPESTPAGGHIQGPAPAAASPLAADVSVDRHRITTPGFTAESSLGQSTRRIRSPSRWRVGRGQGVDAQLTGARFGTRFGGLSTIGDYWSCKDGCASAHRQCLDSCEGTWESPKGSTNCIICDNDYRACVRGCARDIA